MTNQFKQPRLIGRSEKAILHIAKGQLGMSEETYRDMLQSVGCSSSVELDFIKFDQLMGRLKAAGFRRSHSSAKKSGMHREPAADKKSILSKMEATLADRGLPWSYVDGIADQMFGIERVRFCDVTQTHKVLVALIIYQRRKANKE